QLGANDDLLSVRSELLKQWDENSKFFHGMINRKRANLAVKGVMIEGIRLTRSSDT
ncbi:hypothetical protein Tco_1280427, partial [Tanacetum coccineum]